MDVYLDLKSTDLSSLYGIRRIVLSWLTARASGGRYLLAGGDAISPDDEVLLDTFGLKPDKGVFTGDTLFSDALLFLDEGQTPPDCLKGVGTIFLPSIVDESGVIIDSSDPAINIVFFFEAGFLPGAILNYAALSGWDPGMRFRAFLPEQIPWLFTITRLRSDLFHFSYDDLISLNETHLGRMNPRSLSPYLKPFFEKRFSTTSEKSEGWMAWASELLQDQISLLSEAPQAGEYLFAYQREMITDEAVEVISTRVARGVIEALLGYLNEMRYFNGEESRALLKRLRSSLKKERGWDGKAVMMPIRGIITGHLNGPPLSDILVLVGKEECIHRLELALEWFYQDEITIHEETIQGDD